MTDEPEIREKPLVGVADELEPLMGPDDPLKVERVDELPVDWLGLVIVEEPENEVLGMVLALADGALLE